MKPRAAPPRALLVPLGIVVAVARPTPSAAQDGPWAPTNARIETVSRGVIERGTILIRNGVISAVGPAVTVPADARVMDLAGRTVSPGLIDLVSSAGLPTVPPGGGGQGGGAAQRPSGLEPEKLVAEGVRLSPSDARTLRSSGITAVLISPSRGLFRGQSALLPSRDSAAGSTAIRSPVAQHVGYQGIGAGEYPGSLLGVIATQRQMFYDARRYGIMTDRWRTNPRGMTRPEQDAHLEALVPAARGQQPVFVDARNENEIRRAARLGQELGLKLTVVGATEGWRAPDVLKSTGTVVSLDFPRATEVTGWRYRAGLSRTPGDSAAADAAARKLIEGNAAALHRAGIRFALSSGGKPSDLLPNVRKAVAAGLPAGVALEALTQRAADLAGAGDALGSIEAGKIANLVVSTGPLLADTAKVTAVFVDGERYEITPAPAETPARSAGRNGGSGGAAPGATSAAGTWSITTSSPQGATEGTLTLQQEGTSLTGTLTSDMLGTAPIRDGQITGRRISWSVTVSFGGNSFTLTYTGEIDGTKMQGTVAAGDFGTFPFTGEKKP